MLGFGPRAGVHRVADALQGFRAARAGLLTNTYLLAQSVTLDKRSYQALAVTEEQRSVIEVCAGLLASDGCRDCLCQCPDSCPEAGLLGTA